MNGSESPSGKFENNTLQREFNLPKKFVKAYLDDVLLVLIASRNGASGKELLTDLRALNCDLSPGTVYPHLRDLADEGELTVHDKVRSKEYRIDDPAHLHTRIQQLLHAFTRFQSFLLWQLNATDNGSLLPVSQEQDLEFPPLVPFESRAEQSLKSRISHEETDSDSHD